ncbi:Crp/Fnr family transcriptional regulator [Nonomuraea sp. LP-02]|uniref:Crp/Fnr family transcriptional regulator n=1 Tax=Nonomuraea sp. LP-02 TaxID=3097960 RepID=UPI002E2FBE31|nr:Crp/Fnr family transcriptional regulator [Nonomuraea sp. LP-02]MED7930511.1 Crp/Fnr family transcriptional regulator [Nonomuraea sp. LP-02]
MADALADRRAAAGTRRWPEGTFLHALGEDDQKRLLGLGTQRTYPPGAPLIEEGAADTDVFVLLDGYGKVLGNTVDGRVVLLSVRGKGDVVGELAALDRKRRSASVLALTTVVARVVSRGAFVGFLHDRTSAADALQATMLSEFRRVTRHRLLVSGASVEVRLVLLLDYLIDVYGQRCADGVRIAVPLSQPEVASMIGVAEPSLHRALARLRERNVIGTGHRRLTVRDPEALRALAADARATQA